MKTPVLESLFLIKLQLSLVIEIQKVRAKHKYMNEYSATKKSSSLMHMSKL